jgi:hypothetical protein
MGAPKPKTHVDFVDPKDMGEFCVGVCDALVGLGVALCASGATDRATIAKAMEEVVRQQVQRDGIARPIQQMAPTALMRFFQMPVFTGKPS